MTPEPALVVDSRGTRCPQPVIDLARRITEVHPGEVVALLADDPAALHDVPAWCALRGHEWLSSGDDAHPRAGDPHRVGETVVLYVRRSSAEQ